MNELQIHRILQLLTVVLSIWLINQVANRFSFQLDLTEEKRYTIAESTKELLQGLDREVFFEVYLEGDLPPNFERFRNSILSMLDQFRSESGNKINFKFTDPSQASSAQVRNEFYQFLMQKGLQPTNLNYTQDGNSFQKLIFPSALASIGVDEVAVNLLKGNRATGAEEILNQSIEGLEYELASAINRLVNQSSNRVGLITGHGSPDQEQLAGLRSAILDRYDLYEVNLNGKKELKGYDVIFIVKPRTPFSEEEKYLIDQYIMKGGKAVFLIDALSVNIDSALSEGTVAIPYETNLEDLLFKYGVRVNRNFVLDINSGELPIVRGNFGNQPQIQMLTWPFFPLISNFTKHPSVRNLDAVLTQFTSTIDTVKADGVTKIPLASTTQYSKVLGPPVRVALNDLQSELIPDQFTDGVQNVAYLLEGEFTSLYANRLVPRSFDQNDFIRKGTQSKVVVFADGDLAINDFDPETGEPLALGVEGFTKTTYANDELILNILDYMIDDAGLIETRLREVKIRPLDKVKVQEERVVWQAVNLAGPIVLILLLGLVKWTLRKRKFAGND